MSEPSQSGGQYGTKGWIVWTKIPPSLQEFVDVDLNERRTPFIDNCLSGRFVSSREEYEFDLQFCSGYAIELMAAAAILREQGASNV